MKIFTLSILFLLSFQVLLIAPSQAAEEIEEETDGADIGISEFTSLVSSPASCSPCTVLYEECSANGRFTRGERQHRAYGFTDKLGRLHDGFLFSCNVGKTDTAIVRCNAARNEICGS